ncbi:MAG: vitamin K epoxide reductase family protein [Muribaculaceae bacterium]|nr:vitamin K epoxide reductase family protein [Muribaculaceae bacterium]
MAARSLFTRFLSALGVPHTADYSDGRFRSMTFNSLFGLSHLLKDYGIPNRGLAVSDRSELAGIATPYLAQASNGVFVIVTDIDVVKGIVSYDSLGVSQTMPLSEFEQAMNGNVLVAFPNHDSAEPDYRSHRVAEVAGHLSVYALAAAALAVVTYFIVTRGVYRSWATVGVALFDCIGLYFSYLLLQKSLNIHTKAADRVCGVLEKGGCDSIMSLKVSKLFGVFSWSEVGFGYFGISFVTLLVFPHLWPSLALCNVCCLPYTVWSIWYQRFRAHRWCTLCVGVQTTLWLLFFCYLGGGIFHGAFPLKIDTFVLVAVYVAAVLSLNLLLRFFKNLLSHEENS